VGVGVGVGAWSVERGASTGNVERSAWVRARRKVEDGAASVYIIGTFCQPRLPPLQRPRQSFLKRHRAGRGPGLRRPIRPSPLLIGEPGGMSLSLAMNWLSKSHVGGQIALSLMLMLAAGQAGVWMPYPRCWNTRNEPEFASCPPWPHPASPGCCYHCGMVSICLRYQAS
jgi:hypothetical protein